MPRVNPRLSVLAMINTHRLIRDLHLIETRPYPSPMIYAGGVAIAELNAGTPGNELVNGSCSLLVSPYTGTVVCYGIGGNVLWTYNAPHNGYVDELCTGDINGDGFNEVAVVYNQGDDAGVTLLAHDGTFLWHYAITSTIYARSVCIGKVRSDYSNLQLVVGTGGSSNSLRLLDKDGNVIWNKTNTLPPGGYSGTIQKVKIVDMDGDGQAEIYFTQDTDVVKYDYLGNLVWRTDISALPGQQYNKTFGLSIGLINGVQRIAAENEGCGTNGRCCLLDKDGNILWIKNVPLHPGCVEMADVNNDGINEILAEYSADGYATSCEAGFLVLDGSGNIIGRYLLLGADAPFMAIGDVNNDGKNEIVAPCNNGSTYILGW